MVVEMNQALIEGEERTLTLMAPKGQVTCLAGGTAERRTRWLLAILGFEPLSSGYICVDGEPLSPLTQAAFRHQMAWAPAVLPPVGEVHIYAPPTVQEVFALHANAERPISNGILAEEMRRVAPSEEAQTDPRSQLLAVAVLLGLPILLVDDPLPAFMPYLHVQASQGKTILVASNHPQVLADADSVVELL